MAEPTASGGSRALNRDDRQLIELTQQLTPAASLNAIGEHAKWLVSTVGTLGSLLLGFGLLSADELAGNGLAQGLAIVSFLAAAIALIVAVSSLRLRKHELNTRDLAHVEAWYKAELRRATSQKVAAFLLLGAFVAASLAATVALVCGPPRDRPVAELMIRDAGGGVHVVTGAVECTSCEEGPAHVVLVETIGSREHYIVNATMVVGEDGTATLELPDIEVDGRAVVELLVDDVPMARQQLR